MVSWPNDFDVSAVRRAWSVLEPYHAMIFFAPEAREAYAAAGLKGYWMGYFASRAAPLGAVPASVVTATFYNFHPRMVARAIPDAWHFSSPEHILEVRLQAADAALRRLLGPQVADIRLAEAAELSREAARACPVEGRPLFAAYQALSWPAEPHLVLWHAATLLREFRGDGHVVALMAAGLDGCEAHVTLVGTGKVPRELLQPNRGWSDEEWEAASQRLQQKGLLDEEGRLTPAGQALRQEVEERTDLLALPPWRHLGNEQCARLISLVRPFSISIVDQGGVPMPNPIGAPPPTTE
ncbi:MAG: SCO6745 family protein [Ktedonobacterales bacterium]